MPILGKKRPTCSTKPGIGRLSLSGGGEAVAESGSYLHQEGARKQKLLVVTANI